MKFEDCLDKEWFTNYIGAIDDDIHLSERGRIALVLFINTDEKFAEFRKWVRGHSVSGVLNADEEEVVNAAKRISKDMAKQFKSLLMGILVTMNARDYPKDVQKKVTKAVESAKNRIETAKAVSAVLEMNQDSVTVLKAIKKL